jgi:hypothetical protein
MKWKLSAMVMATLFLASVTGLISPNQQSLAQAKEVEQKITVLNPLGTPPPIKLKPMAPRLDTMEGKTIYIVNDGYPGSGIMLKELTAVCKEKFPNTTFVYKDKPGGMGRTDEALWKEIDERADAMVIALGH